MVNKWEIFRINYQVKKAFLSLLLCLYSLLFLLCNFTLSSLLCSYSLPVASCFSSYSSFLTSLQRLFCFIFKVLSFSSLVLWQGLCLKEKHCNLLLCFYCS
ncbi:hypothetical protein V6Z11_A06G123200 [Gossypium hirsutum]